MVLYSYEVIVWGKLHISYTFYETWLGNNGLLTGFEVSPGGCCPENLNCIYPSFIKCTSFSCNFNFNKPIIINMIPLATIKNTHVSFSIQRFKWSFWKRIVSNKYIKLCNIMKWVAVRRFFDQIRWFFPKPVQRLLIILVINRESVWWILKII